MPRELPRTLPESQPDQSSELFRVLTREKRWQFDTTMTMGKKNIFPIFADHAFETQEEGDRPPRERLPEMPRDPVLDVSCRPSGAS